jgi:hypothetical protein
MKQLMILGGMLGFLIGVGFGWINRSPWPDIIWRSLLVTYLSALLMRWWGQIWIRGLRECQGNLASGTPAHVEAAPASQPTSAPAK